MVTKAFNTDGTPTRATVAYLAGVFADVIWEWSTPEQWEAIRRANARYVAEGKTDICATHDFFDANMAMDDAFRRAFGAGPLDGVDEMSESDVALWNAAWAMATRGWLTADNDVARPQPLNSTSASMQRARELIAAECDEMDMPLRARLYRNGGNDNQPELRALAKLLDGLKPRPLGEILRDDE